VYNPSLGNLSLSGVGKMLSHGVKGETPRLVERERTRSVFNRRVGHVKSGDGHTIPLMRNPKENKVNRSLVGLNPRDMSTH
jgi:hypothetical protein